MPGIDVKVVAPFMHIGIGGEDLVQLVVRCPGGFTNRDFLSEMLRQDAGRVDGLFGQQARRFGDQVTELQE